ncbi:hypothetical protein AS031_17635 [Pseudarthrobacter enclensis]|uniref:Uncharacterized protein n=1 Tax=Pseudarthrobacter enclensis TaxID=993070 RepID=A0A0V8I794_9MICC|nr:hypothetical protein AS031_17635 [Pseudarthrobacter enclensis]
MGIAKALRVAMVAGCGLLGVAVVFLAAVGDRSLPSLLVLTAGLLCMAGILLIIFRSLGQWGQDPEYRLSGPPLLSVFALCALSGVLVVWSTSL